LTIATHATVSCGKKPSESTPRKILNCTELPARHQHVAVNRGLLATPDHLATMANLAALAQMELPDNPETMPEREIPSCPLRISVLALRNPAIVVLKANPAHLAMLAQADHLAWMLNHNLRVLQAHLAPTGSMESLGQRVRQERTVNNPPANPVPRVPLDPQEQLARSVLLEILVRTESQDHWDLQVQMAIVVKTGSPEIQGNKAGLAMLGTKGCLDLAPNVRRHVWRLATRELFQRCTALLQQEIDIDSTMTVIGV